MGGASWWSGAIRGLPDDRLYRPFPRASMNHEHRPIGHGAAHRAGLLRIDAAGLVDGAGTSVRGASVLLEISPGTRPRLLAAGRAADVLTHPAATRADTTVVLRPSSVLLPGLVNAHTHLDLTHIGPQPHDPAAGFVPWVDMIRSRRHTDEAAIAASVRRGIELCVAGGCVAIGDIGGAPAGRLSLAPWRTLRDSGVAGVSFLEYFGIGASLEPRSAGLMRLVDEVAAEAGEAAAKDQAGLGLQPHAPNTVALSLYRLSIALAERLPGSRLCTHLAETIEEREFIARGTGPQRELLERFGLWTDAVMDELGRGEHPVEHLAGVLQSAQGRLAAVHVNDATDAAIGLLAKTGATVVYCPRASAYFAAESRFGPHRYRDMLAAGIPVALGTDSIVNLPASAAATPAESPQGRGISILDEMRLLHARDGTDPVTLIQMATINGATAIGLDPAAFSFASAGRGGGEIQGVISVEVGPELGGVAASVLKAVTPVEILCM